MPERQPSRTAGLIRVSDPNRAEKGYSIPDQEQDIRTYCERAGDLLVELVVDGGVSGKIINRPGLDRIDALIQEKAIDKVVYVRQDRLSREPWRALQLLAHWRAQGILVISCERPTLTGRTAAERMIEAFDASAADMEWERIRERCMGGRQTKARRGAYPGYWNIYGYRVITRAEATVLPEWAGRDGEVVPVPEQVEILRELFRKADAGIGESALADDLNARGVPAPGRGKDGGRRWYHTVIKRMLRNTAYIGEAYYGRCEHRRNPNGKGRGRSVERPEEEWQPILCPPIIDPDLFHRLQGKLDARGEVYRGRPSHTWALSGVVFCGSCVTLRGTPGRCHGERKTRNKNSQSYEWRRYACRFQERFGSGKQCGSGYEAKALEAMAWEALWLATEPGALGEILAERERARHGERSAAQAQLPELQKRLAELDQEERGIAKLVMVGISPHIVAEQVASVKARRANLQTQVRQAQSELRTGRELLAAQAAAEERAAQVRAQLEASRDDPGQLQAVYRETLRIVLKKGEAPDIQVFPDLGLPSLVQK